MFRMKKIFPKSTLIAVVLSLFTFSIVLAASGALDTSFNGNGKLLHDVTPDMDDRAYAVAVQSDGKIVVAGYNLDPIDPNVDDDTPQSGDVVVVRYNEDGTLDTSFNAAGDIPGVIVTDAGGFDQARDVDIRGGKIVVSGNSCVDPGFSECDLLVIRYNMDGTLDTGFNGDGIATLHVDYGNNGTYGGLRIDSKGKVVVAGFSRKMVDAPYSFTIYRFTSNGYPDTYWGGKGYVTSRFGTATRDVAQDLAIQGDGKVIASGYTCNTSGSKCDIAIARYYGGNGMLDKTFSFDGRVSTDFGGEDFAPAIALQPDGKILVAGYRQSGSNTYMIIARLKSNGVYDTTFNKTGKKIVDFMIGYSELDYDVLVRPSDGKIIMAGYVTKGKNNFAIARLMPSGALDTSFSGDGKLDIQFGYDDIAYAVAADGDGRFVLAGRSKQTLATDPATYQYYFAIARVLP